ncbi:imidazole glycerol phosphate synthase subunit HisH [Patescibacteria group bacterium]|nr:imidazole glycerol phosphate synthase subunit HisH [Patescibacteria group bacterium]
MNNLRVCILDYGSGNVQSVYNIFKILLLEKVVVSNKTADIESASHIVLPGVGAFGAAMEKIKKKIPLDVLSQAVLKDKKPFLGICVGMQVLADKGYEFGEHQGLGWIAGEVIKMESGELPLPHIGWNNINIIKESPLLEKFDDNQDFYFVHSYAFKEKDASNVIATTEYGEKFCSIISKDNIFGVQFHPEKSQKAGRILLENFIQHLPVK